MVLVVDDEVAIRDLIVRTLRAHDIHAEPAGPTDALERIEALHPQVVVLDVNMPVYDGYAVLGAIRSDARFDDTFVLMLTGRAGIDDVRTSFEAGADDYLHKPFNPMELVARVHRALVARPLSGHGSPSPDSGMEK